jgi:hypothetical protein
LKVGSIWYGRGAPVTGSRTPAAPAKDPPQMPGRLSQQITQIVIAVGCAAAISWGVWGLVGSQLSVSTDIVGSTIFNNLDIYGYIDHFYIITVLFPLVSAAVYVALARWGPLARRESTLWPPSLAAHDVLSTIAPPPVPQPLARAAEVFGVVLRMAFAALVIALEIDVARSPQVQTLHVAAGLAATVAYGAAVTILALLLLIFLRRLHVEWRTVWSAVNAVLATAVVPLLWLVSDSTSVSVASDSRVVRYPWFPAWLAAAATAAVLAIITVAFVRRGWRAARGVERGVLVAVVGPAAIFLLSAKLQAAQAGFNGFDDAQAMAGARLMFAHGLWPWRDVFLLHGFLTDGVYGGIGMLAFGATRWGSNSGITIFAVPFAAIALYAFMVHFARRNYPLVAAGCAALVLGLFPDWAATRYALIPIVLVLLDRVLRRATWARCWAFMAVAVVTSIVTPESTLLVVGFGATLLVAELVHHERRRSLRDSFRRSIRCAVAGLTLTAVWALFLAATGSLAGFVAYYQVNATGHELWGANPVVWPFVGDRRASVEFALPIALFLLTVAKVAVKLHRRSTWRTSEWVLVASATAVPLFYPLAFDRFDPPHVGEVFQTVLPFVLLWAADFFFLAASALTRSNVLWWVARRRARARHVQVSSRRGARSTWIGVTLASLATILGAVLISPVALTSFVDLPSQFHTTVPTEPPPALPLGYTVPGAVDVNQIQDLGAVINRYAGATAPVFEFVNEMGVTYFLLDRIPGERFPHIEAAETEAAQRLVIDDLEHSRPPVVIFNDLTFGLPNYDDIWSMERQYLVSQYILDHYRPMVDVSGQIVMLRSDLANSAPPLPALRTQPLTAGLYFADEPACDWGDIPDFLHTPTPAEVLAAAPTVVTGPGEPVTTASGWAYDKGARQAPVAILAAQGGIVVGQTTTNISRADVAAHFGDQAALMTGWSLSVLTSSASALGFYAENSDGTVTALNAAGAVGVPATIRTDQGASYRVVERAGTGNVEHRTVSSPLSMEVSGPAPLTAYQWLQFHSDAGFGNATIRVTDIVDGASPSHSISFSTLPRVGHTVYLRVGSCIQWHGYETHHLYLFVQGVPSDMSVRLLP